jgi:hypothetical protein
VCGVQVGQKAVSLGDLTLGVWDHAARTWSAVQQPVMHASRQGLSLRNSTPASVVFEALLRGLGIFCVGLLDWRGSASSSSSRRQHQECGSSTRAAAAGGGQQQHPSHTQLRSFMPGTVAVRACVCFLGGGVAASIRPVKTTGVRAQVKQWVTQCPTRGTFKALCILGTPMWLLQCGLGTRTSLLASKQHIMVLSLLAAQKLA